MRYDVELIVRPSTIIYEGIAFDTNYAGCFAIRVPFDLTAYDGGAITWNDPVYGDISDTYSIVGPWTGLATTIALTTCRPWLDTPATGVVRVTFPESKVLELYENESISQNWRFADLQTFEALGSFSRQFRVPATKNNLEAIGYLNDVNFDAAIDYFQIKLPAELRVQTLPISSGYVRVMRVITQADRIADFELTFYAESPDLFNKLTGKKLKDIEALSELNEVLDYNEVLSATGYPYLYSLTDYGQKWDETGSEGSRSIFTQTLFGAPRAGDLTPSLNWQWIFEKIIKEAGFTYDGTILDNIINRYYAPWINAKNLQYVESAQSFAFKIYNASPIAMTAFTQHTWVSTGEDFDNGTTVVGNTFTAPATGLYTFRYWYTFASSVSYLGFQFRFFFLNITTGASVQITESVINAGTTNFDSTNNAPLFFLRAGDQFRVAYQTTVSGVTLLDGSSYTDGTGLELIDIDFMDGATLDWAANSPDETQADFVRDVLNMHCCVLVPDRVVANRLIITPIKDYLETGANRDWSSKLDISKDITLSNTSDFQSRRLKFTYSEGEDMFSQIYKSLGRIYGDYEIDAYTVSENDVPNDFASNSEQTIQLTTQSTPVNYIDGTSIPIPKFVDDEGNFVSPKLRCLFHAGDYEMVLYDFATSLAEKYVVPVLNHYELIQPVFTSLDLNWAPEVPLYIQGINPLDNLFNVYWRDYLNQLYSPSARIMEAYFALNLTDILSFSFADRIWVKDAWWRILEVNDYKVGESETTRVTLMKLIDAVPEVSARPNAVTDGGVIEFVDGAGDPVSPTQESCERFGYTWDPVSKSCYASTAKPQNTNAAIATKVTGRSTKEVQNASNTIVMADELDNHTSNLYTVAVGTKITLGAQNSQSIAVGELLTKGGFGRVAMFGTNVYTKQSGFHIGGGYRDGNPANSSYIGWAQSGIIVMHTKKTWAASGDTYNLEVEGVPDNYLNLPDETLWSVLMNVTIMDTLAAGNYHTGQYSFALTKQSGIAQSSSVQTIQDTGGFGSYVFTFGIDTVTSSDEHRIYLEVTGAGTYPQEFIVTASLIYQQGKI